MPTLTKKVFLSSTFLDLEEYRAAAVHACQRVGMLPIAMEDFRPDPRNAAAVCRAKVEEADLFLGIYAHRYGYVPDGSEVSITELEYDWAVGRNLPVYLYVVDPDQPWPPSQVDKGRDFERLKAFKERIDKKHTRGKFRDEKTFREDVLLLFHDLARAESASPGGEAPPSRRALPTPPLMHSVPPYILTNRFIGRRRELDALDAWARSTDPMLVVEAIGGVGKSALTWEWARERAAKVIPGLAGTLWWSFYEGGASTASFVREALAYVTEADPEELRTTPKEEQLQKLLTELRPRPYLLVLDGFERLLTAYHRLDPSKLRDDEVKSDLRACTDSRTEDLLRQFIAASPSKVLVTTRLMPSALENRAHQPLPGVRHQKLAGLDPADGEDLLKSLGVRGNSTVIRKFLGQFDNHSLLIGVLAGRILDYRPASGNFDRWLADPKEGGSLHLSELDLKQRRTHILAYALDGLDSKQRHLLSRIAVLSDAAEYATVSILSPYLPTPPDEIEPPPDLQKQLERDFDLHFFLRRQLETARDKSTRTKLQKQIAAREAELREQHERQTAEYNAYQNALRAYLESSEYRAAITELDKALRALEGRGLLQWDRNSDTYELHPVVRGFAFDQLEETERIQTYERIRDHFEGLPPEDTYAATELSGLRITIQVYRALLGAGQLDRAAELYRSRLSDPLLLSVTSFPAVIELLTPMFRNGLDHTPNLSSKSDQSFCVIDLGFALGETGKKEEALRLERVAIQIDLELKAWENLIIALHNYSASLQSLNRTAASFEARKLSLELAVAAEDQDGVTALYLDFMDEFSSEGRWEEANAAHEQFAMRPTPPRGYYRIGYVEEQLCRLKFWQGSLGIQELEEALAVAVGARNLPRQGSLHRLRAEVALSKGALHEAVEAAEQALEISRKTGAPDPDAKGCLARALALQGRHDEARQIVEDGGVLLWQAAEVYLRVGDLDKAKDHALCAYKDAWADGPPHINWWPLEQSKKVLAQLGVPEPELPPFDPAKVEPIPFEKEIRQVIEELKAEKAKKEAEAEPEGAKRARAKRGRRSFSK